jgi:hypothetical protein
LVSVAFAVAAILAWQVAAISRRRPGDALPLVCTLELMCVASAILSWIYFFWAPIVTSIAEPGGANHFARTNAESVLVQISGFGPTDTHYVDPVNTPKTPTGRSR